MDDPSRASYPAPPTPPNRNPHCFATRPRCALQLHPVRVGQPRTRLRGPHRPRQKQQARLESRRPPSAPRRVASGDRQRGPATRGPARMLRARRGPLCCAGPRLLRKISSFCVKKASSATNAAIRRSKSRLAPATDTSLARLPSIRRCSAGISNIALFWNSSASLASAAIISLRSSVCGAAIHIEVERYVESGGT
jgi:hypothetical protein